MEKENEQERENKKEYVHECERETKSLTGNGKTNQITYDYFECNCYTYCDRFAHGYIMTATLLCITYITIGG